MLYFPQSLLFILIVASLVFIGLAAVWLIVLFIKDFKNKNVW